MLGRHLERDLPLFQQVGIVDRLDERYGDHPVIVRFPTLTIPPFGTAWVDAFAAGVAEAHERGRIMSSMTVEALVVVASYPARDRAEAVAERLRNNKVVAIAGLSLRQRGLWDVVAFSGDADRARVVLEHLPED